MAWESSLVSQLCQEATLATKACQAEDTAQDKGNDSRENVWGGIQRWHNSGSGEHSWNCESGQQQQSDIDQRGGSGYRDSDEEAEKSCYRSREDCHHQPIHR